MDAENDVPDLEEKVAAESELMDQKPIEEAEVFGLLTLIKTVLAPSTMPHLLLLIIATVALYVVTKSGSDGSDVIAAMSFVALSTSYAATAYISGNEAIGRILRTSPYEVNADEEGPNMKSKIVHLLKQITKAWALPLCITGAIMLLLVFLLGDEGPLSNVGTSLPMILASLFVLWSIGQALSFRTSATTYIEGRLEAKEDSDKRGSFAMTATTMVVINLIIGGLLIFIFVSIQDTELNTDNVEATMLKHVLYLIALAVSQGLILWWSKPLIETAIKYKRSSIFSMKWGILVQAFAAWHLMSIYRQYAMNSPQTFTIFEELMLMILTVLLAIWGTTTKGMAKGSSVFTKENALFWGLAFGFGYAGSITMVANVLGDVKTVLMAGHAITWISLLILHRMALRDFVYSENLIGKSDLISEEEESDNQIQSGSSGTDDKDDVEADSIGDDEEVDWSEETPEPIDSDDDWGDAQEEDEVKDDFEEDLELID